MIRELETLQRKIELLAAVKVIVMQGKLIRQSYFDAIPGQNRIDSKVFDTQFVCPGCGEKLHFMYGLPRWQSPWSKDWQGWGPMALAHDAPRHSPHPSEVVPNDYWLINENLV